MKKKELPAELTPSEREEMIRLRAENEYLRAENSWSRFFALEGVASMQIYFAPMEGVTDTVYRRAHRDLFPSVDKYFIPFISPTQDLRFTSREMRAVSPEENAGLPVVPQILTKNAEHFVSMTRMLADVGYTEVNLNLGCPSGTVTAKGKGAGMLREPAALNAFLDEVFSKAAVKVSIKTRIGWESPDEWPRLLEIFAQYPVSEMIVHLRTRSEFYKGAPHSELCSGILAKDAWPFVYNGDIYTVEDCAALRAQYPAVSAVMIGRGLLTNPALARQIRGGAPLSEAELWAFHDRLYSDYMTLWPYNAVCGHMREIMSYLTNSLDYSAKIQKALRKAATPEAYQAALLKFR